MYVPANVRKDMYSRIAILIAFPAEQDNAFWSHWLKTWSELKIML